MFNNFIKTTKDSLLTNKDIKSVSPKGVVDSTDLGKVAAHVAVGMALAGLTILAEWASKADFGAYTVFVLPALTGLYQVAKKWLTEHDVAV